MAGRYIINQTAGKRVVILDEDNDKVEGGYFNTDGAWVPFGGDTIMPFLYKHSLATGDVSGVTRARLTTASKRIAMAAPIKNPGKTFKAKSEDYALNLLGVEDLNGTIATVSGTADMSYPIGSDPIEYVSEATRTEPYVWLAISKTSAEFTANEILNAEGVVYELV